MDKKQIDNIANMVRVNHAGEKGALHIYEGQAFIFNKKDKASALLVEEMAEHEKVHFDYFDNLLAKNHIRPTVLLPLWHLGGFALGAATALLGRKAALACTQAVEEVIDHHYTNQIENLEETSDFKENLETFREDERSHHGIAEAENKDDYPLMRFGISSVCRIAIALSTRF